MNAQGNTTTDGSADEAWRDLFARARHVTEYGAMQSLCRARRKLLALGPAPPQPAHARIALLGGATTSMLEAPLLLSLDALGVAAELHATPYNAFAREMLDPDSATAAFRPNITVIVATPFNIPAWPRLNATEEEVDAVVDEVCEYWVGLCRALQERVPCDIALSNFHPLPSRPLGSMGARSPGDPNRFLRCVNHALVRRLPPNVHIHDVESLASMYGVYQWFDERYWYHARQPVSFACLVPYVRSLAQMIGALLGRSCKCVVLDLDDTLWGGVVGDDGAERLVLGEGDPRGEAFIAFQRYLLRLKERGVLLAVCSKNDERIALTPFVSRPEMLLHRDDFAAFHANWRPKSDNLREIAVALGIGLDSLVFVDDNPAEQEQIRQALPDVRVVDLGPDPADYVSTLDRAGWLDSVVVSGEDRQRGAMYKANAARQAARSAITDYDVYLRSLDQRAIIAPFEIAQLDRITQLTNKTNQFNLTTRRMSRAELEYLASSAVHLTATVRLIDRFGDNGLISVFGARIDGADLWIDLWLMSCRVFNRGVERLLFNHVVERASAAGCRSIHGIYRPTDRNALVKDLYGSLGFAPAGTFQGGDQWELDVDAYRPFATAISTENGAYAATP
ncbi:MAG: HAD-IIIC family phosphatase [Gemmatimonadaceae bacterium]